MKKIMMMLAATASLFLASCQGNSTNNSDNSSDSIQNVAQVAAALTSALQSGNTEVIQQKLAEAQDYIAQLTASGQLDEAKAYAAQVQEFITTNEESIKSIVGDNNIVNSTLSAIKAIPTDATNTASDAASNVADAADDAVNAATEAAANAKQAASDAASNAKQAVSDAASNAKQATSDAASNAKQAASDAASNAIDNAASNAKKKLGL